MKCIVCLFDTKEPIIINNQVYCQQCNDINDFANDIKKEKIVEIKIIETKVIKTQHNNYIKCPKCKKKFATKKCSCGYTNLFI